MRLTYSITTVQFQFNYSFDSILNLSLNQSFETDIKIVKIVIAQHLFQP
jgi:hypothetical protein